MGGKHHPLQHAILPDKSSDRVFNHLDLIPLERFFLLLREGSMTVGTDQHIPSPIPDDFGHVKSLLPFFCDHNKRLLLEFPSVAVGAAKHTFAVIVVNASYRGKCLFQAGGKDDGSGLND